LEGQLQKLSSLVALNVDEIGPRDSLVDLGLDSLMVTEFKDWLKCEFGADIGSHDIIDAAGLGALTALVGLQSTFILM
jgi:aryl carrier-like protein